LEFYKQTYIKPFIILIVACN